MASCCGIEGDSQRCARSSVGGEPAGRSCLGGLAGRSTFNIVGLIWASGAIVFILLETFPVLHCLCHLCSGQTQGNLGAQSHGPTAKDSAMAVRQMCKALYTLSVNKFIDMG